jgi:hypothetical protein
MKAKNNDHAIATVARVVLGTMGVLAGLLIIRSIPDLVRYVKMERM